jgi:mannosyl-oligosaccharide alpha-1,2-mannosidase
MGMSMLDALDTMWIMGMKEEFTEALEWVVEYTKFSKVYEFVSFLETSIRALGGLLSAFDLSGDKRLLLKAQDLADRYGGIQTIVDVNSVVL